MSNESRFMKAYKEGGTGFFKTILVDKETGVNYLYVQAGYSGGLTPLLDADGKPVITKPAKKRED
ncbi:MAG: xylan 1,4-beta-xylosidase [Ruminococcaceae bacterium]|nr:xylan 1,4-beta-xylosidase [Oscillospiraceae bacterium]